MLDKSLSHLLVKIKPDLQNSKYNQEAKPGRITSGV